MSENLNKTINKKPDVSNDTVTTVKSEFKKRSELSFDDLKLMDNARCSLKVNYNKKTQNTRYILTATLKNGMQLSKDLTNNQYILICLKRKLDNKLLQHDFVCPIRFVLGTHTDVTQGNWIRYEIFVCSDVVVDDFFNRYDFALYEHLRENFGYKVIKSDEKLDPDNNLLEDFYN